MASDNETVADIIAMLRWLDTRDEPFAFQVPSYSSIANRVEAAWRREKEELQGCLGRVMTAMCSHCPALHRR